MKEATLLKAMKEIKVELSESQEYYWISAMDLIFDLLGLYFSLLYRTLTFSNPNNDGESYRFLLTFLYFMYAVICLQDPKCCLF